MAKKKSTKVEKSVKEAKIIKIAEPVKVAAPVKLDLPVLDPTQYYCFRSSFFYKSGDCTGPAITQYSCKKGNTPLTCRKVNGGVQSLLYTMVNGPFGDDNTCEGGCK